VRPSNHAGRLAGLGTQVYKYEASKAFQQLVKHVSSFGLGTQVYKYEASKACQQLVKHVSSFGLGTQVYKYEAADMFY
jgi:uncharacterized protein (UPF0128 family)